MAVLIAGCGDLGTEVGLRLIAAGREVTGWRRRPDLLPQTFQRAAADLGRADVPPVPTGTDIVVITIAADASDEGSYRRAYIDGVRHTMDALVRDGVSPRRALFVSSTAVYGDLDGAVDETSPADPTAFNGRVLLEAEEIFLRHLPHGTVLRLGGIYGPGRERLLDQVRRGEARTTARRTSRIHRDDAAAAIVHLMTMADPPQALYLGVDDLPAPQRDVVEFLAAELRAPEPAPARTPGRRGADRAVSNARLRATGWVPTYPTYVEGYRAVLAGEDHRHL